MTAVHDPPSAPRSHPAVGALGRRRPLSRTECLQWLQSRTVGRLAMTAGALPHVAVIRYYLMGETVYIDMGSADAAGSITGHVVALETGTSDADQQHETWSVCVVGVVTRSPDAPDGETILEMHLELLSGWISTRPDPDSEAGMCLTETAAPA